ncbi:MAG: TRAP transporter small permease [Thermodesulfobacteriota bacterium]|jgi:C4-dicarboxylate transporter DctQ subunit|nr:TRAP transporter small permease [Thermodesulfobacteriota bacterium]
MTDKILHIIEKILENISVICLFIITCFILLEVISRYFFSASSGYYEEFNKYLFVYLVLLISAVGMRKGTHIRIEMIDSLFSPRVIKSIQFINHIGILAVMGCFLYSGILLAWSCYVSETCWYIGNIILPQWVVWLAFPLGMFFALVYSIEDFVKFLCNLKPALKSDPEP